MSFTLDLQDLNCGSSRYISELQRKACLFLCGCLMPVLQDNLELCMNNFIFLEVLGGLLVLCINFTICIANNLCRFV